MIGNGTLALAAVEPLRAIGAVSPEILDVELRDLDGPWETAIVGGRQAIELVTFPDTLFPTEEPA